MLHKELKLKQVTELFERMRAMEIPNAPKEGWLKTIRTALWMSMDKAASRAGVNTSTWEKTEKREQKGTVTIETLQKMANAVNCDVRIVFVAHEPLNQMLKKQALTKAEKEIQRLDETMSLEKQKTSSSFLQDMKDQLVQKYINNPKDIWQ